MKRIVFLLTLCLVVISASQALAQRPTLKILANSNEINGTLVLKGTQRLTFLVSDGMPANSGYAYEFGALQLVPANGAPIELQARSVENSGMRIYSLRTSHLQTYPAGFTLRLDGVRRHNPGQVSELLPFSNQQLEILVLPN
ncbi:MAG: hypothetical protein U0176_10895 [Bacteroidia bacterium]